MAEAPASFEGAPTGVGTWLGDRSKKQCMTRPPSQESPVQALARRKDRDGKPFLTRVMVRAAERLREDFELSVVLQNREKRTTLNWRELLHSIETYQPIDTNDDNAVGEMRAALVFLGPGLSEVALRCCCLLEGLETTEKRMGWAARSCKVVLRIALQRLVLHYEEGGKLGPRIG